VHIAWKLIETVVLGGEVRGIVGFEMVIRAGCEGQRWGRGRGVAVGLRDVAVDCCHDGCSTIRREDAFK
jgi:hypothetical protein